MSYYYLWMQLLLLLLYVVFAFVRSLSMLQLLAMLLMCDSVMLRAYSCNCQLCCVHDIIIIISMTAYIFIFFY